MQTRDIKYFFIKLSCLFILCFPFCERSFAQINLGCIENILSNEPVSDLNFPIVSQAGIVASIVYDKSDFKGVIRAAQDLQKDIFSVTDVKPELNPQNTGIKYQIIVGTIGHSQQIKQLSNSGKLDIEPLQGKWESFVISTIDNPYPDVAKCLVIAGSDKRGTIYGIYELSKQLGVSPWYWWADVPPNKRTSAYVLNGTYYSGEPKVKYRGIFINDENPCMQRWAKEKFGGLNGEMYVRVYELLLRLHANLLWPGMWGSMKEYNPLVPILKDESGNYLGNSFNEDDDRNPRVADEYGIVIGTSHHEPMQRSQQEWIRNKTNYGNGEWNYLTNKKGIQQFFKEGIEHTKDYESLITIGMRGDDDKPMVDAGSAEANFRILEGIIKDQRQIIKEATGRNASEMPQVWTLYKEVLEYYGQGMKVPDDVIVAFCDDNWGDVRRLPELNEKKHPGGYGMYYHVGYYGAPRANKWLNVTQIQQMWEQLQLTYDYGVDKLWILNVGDLKPNEYPMDFFLNMAWNPKNFTLEHLDDYYVEFCAQQFGSSQAQEASCILNTYCKYASRVTPEMLDENTYNLQSGEFKMARDEFLALEARALRQYIEMPEVYKDTYFQLVLFPVQALANVYDMYYSVAMNQKLAKEKDTAANFWADRVERCFKRDGELTNSYNQKLANGKWNHMMDQVHIGYTSWHAPQFNIMPTVIRISFDEVQTGGYVFSEKNGVVAIEAEHYFNCQTAANSQWQIIPNMGRTLSGIALMPYTEKTDGSFLSYKFKLNAGSDSIKVRLYLDSTLSFKKGGHSIAVAIAGGKEKIVNINNELVWKNCYTKMYPTAAARMIELEITVPLPYRENGNCILKIKPLDPGIVFYKIIIDNGGFEESFLKMPESPYEKITQ